jgi:hypothetical protein
MTHRYISFAAFALLSLAAVDAVAQPCPATTISPNAALPPATIGSPWSQSFAAFNGSAPSFTFSVAGGLPNEFGLSFKATSATSAILSGSPTQVGTYAVTIAATDTAGCTGGRTYTLVVGTPPR